ncbi:Proline iminopeptidase [Nymphaea thermarum]|nr:Proline iminopeptidase [Nymphaea thermarum]
MNVDPRTAFLLGSTINCCCKPKGTPFRASTLVSSIPKALKGKGGVSFCGNISSLLRVQNNRTAMVETPDSLHLNKDPYPPLEPYSSGFLKVSEKHTLYWEQSGNPSGYPVVFLHGGPGAGTSPSNRKFFDPEHYRIILFDQVFGGSWGSTLALAYSQSHPDKVTGIILRGIFLLRKKELDWFYEGGAAAIFPDAWEPFRDFIPENERDSFIKAYSKRLNSEDIEIQKMAARFWTTWELMTAHLLPNEENIQKGDDDSFSLAFARIENHYFINKGFLPCESHLLDNIDKIRHIPTVIVQGRYDVCCPMMSAWDLHKAWPEAEFKIIADAGHSANEPGITAELVAGNEKLKYIHQK